MFKKILVPLDGSENSERAVPWAKRYARSAHAQVILIRCVAPGHPEEVEEARRYLQGWEREFNFAGIPAKFAVRWGPPAVVIVRAATLRQVDVIIMATRGGSLVQRWLIGGVTEQVMRMSPKPVLVVRSQMALPKQGRVSRILVPVDGSAIAESVIPSVERLARFHRARIEFVHVQGESESKSVATARTFDEFKRRMARACQGLRERGVKTAFQVGRGDPALEILRLSRRADLVAMTTHGYGGFKRWIFGSVAEKVIHDAGVPVLVYKGPVRRAQRVSLASAAV